MKSFRLSPIVIISTRAPTGGATHAGGVCAPGGRYFYSRPHGRGDFSGVSGLVANQFLLVPPREGRLEAVAVVVEFHLFLLAPPREGRLLLYPIP